MLVKDPMAFSNRLCMSFHVVFSSYITVAFTHEVLDLDYRSTELERFSSNTTPVHGIHYRIESSTDLQ